MDSSRDITDNEEQAESKKQTPKPVTRSGSRQTTLASARKAAAEATQELENALKKEKVKNAKMAREIAKRRADAQQTLEDNNALTAHAKKLEKELELARATQIISKSGNTTVPTSSESKNDHGQLADLTKQFNDMSKLVAANDAETTKTTEILTRKMLEAESKVKELKEKLEEKTTLLNAIPVAKTTPAPLPSGTRTGSPVTTTHAPTPPMTSTPGFKGPVVGQVREMDRMLSALKKAGLATILLGDHWEDSAIDEGILEKSLRASLPVFFVPQMLAEKASDSPEIAVNKLYLSGALQRYVSVPLGTSASSAATPVVPVTHGQGETKSNKSEGLSATDVEEIRNAVNSVSVEHGLDDEGKALLLRMLERARVATLKVDGMSKEESGEQLRFVFDKIFEIIVRDAELGSPIYGSTKLVKEQYDAGKLRTLALIESVLVNDTFTFGRLLDATKPKPKKTTGGIATDDLTNALASMLSLSENSLEKKRRLERHQKYMVEWFITIYKIFHSDRVGRALAYSFNELQNQTLKQLEVNPNGYDEIMAASTDMLKYFMTVVVKIIHPIVLASGKGTHDAKQLSQALRMLDWEYVGLVTQIQSVTKVGSVDFGNASARVVTNWLKAHHTAVLVAQMKTAMGPYIDSAVASAVKAALSGGATTSGGATKTKALGNTGATFSWSEAEQHQILNWHQLPFGPNTNQNGDKVSMAVNGVKMPCDWCGCHLAASKAPTSGPLAGRTADFTCHAAPEQGKTSHMISRVPFDGAGEVTTNGVTRACMITGCLTTKGKVFVHSYA